jgi:hypothetical protein
MHFEKFRSLFTKTQPNLQNGKAAPDIESSRSRTASTGLEVPDHTGQPGLILLNPDFPKSNGDGSMETYALDIVAIHGITGDVLRTWTHANGTNWVRDFIPNAFPGARVFSFGYPAEVFWSRSDGDIDSFARSLLEGLKRERRQLKVNLPLESSKRYQDVSIWLHPALLTWFSIDLGVLCLFVTVWEVSL